MYCDIMVHVWSCVSKLSKNGRRLPCDEHEHAYSSEQQSADIRIGVCMHV